MEVTLNFSDQERLRIAVLCWEIVGSALPQLKPGQEWAVVVPIEWIFIQKPMPVQASPVEEAKA